MRAFIAIDLPQDIHNELARWQTTFRRLVPDARWARPEKIHLTLKFLGEITAAQAQLVTQALSSLGTFEKFSVELHGFGFFPDARRPRVFWAGVMAPPQLERLASRIEDSLHTLGFARESRRYNPHLTLARFREPRPQTALSEAAEKQSGVVIGRFDVTEYFLFESKLHPQGAEYRKVAQFPHH